MDQKYIEEMVCSRRKLHKIPEEGWTEFQTTYFVVEFLRSRTAGIRRKSKPQS